MINSVRHRFRSDQYDSPERKGVKITDKGTPVSGLTLSAIILNCNRSSELYGQIIGMKEDLNNEGVYHPDTESLKADDCGSSAFLVFSTEKNSLVRPYALYLYDELNVEQRNKLKRESIEKIGRLLRYEDCDPEEYEQEWHDVKLCTELAVDHNLPFTTFNCFFSIQSDPDLLAEFCYRALKFNIPNMNVYELISF